MPGHNGNNEKDINGLDLLSSLSNNNDKKTFQMASLDDFGGVMVTYYHT
jgi:hypothetical protein